jgi:hypothetical protein
VSDVQGHRALRRRRRAVGAALPAGPAVDAPRLSLRLVQPDTDEGSFVCSVCHRDMLALERSRIAPSKCRACT